MPERLPTAKPTVICGTTVESGVPNTGQVPYTFGGTHTYTKFSGVVGPDVNIWVGGGRLDAAFLFAQAGALAASGQAIVLYDSAVAVSGGPIAASGHKVVGFITSPYTASGNVIYGNAQDLGTVFTSGLCHSTTSGQPGFTVSFTPTISG